MYAYKYTSPSVSAVFGGSESPGIKLVGTYYSDVGVTANTGFELRYYAIDEDGQRYPSTGYSIYPTGTLVLGSNIVNMAVTPTTTTYNKTVTLNVFDTLTIDGAGGDFSFNLADLTDTSKNSGAISGGVWNDTLPSSVVNEEIISTYQGAFSPQQGDYSLVYRVTDPNGATTDSNAIVNAWSPYVFINGYKVTGAVYDLDVEGPVSIAGYNAIDLQYILGGEIATDGSGNPIYGAGGEIGYVGGTLQEELAVSFVKGDNEFIIANIADDYGNTTSTYPFDATRIPAIRYDGLTTVDAETYGTTYDGALSLVIDEGLAEETTATPEEAPYSFTADDYRIYNFTGTYTYPATTASNSVPVVITYKEFSVTPLTVKVWDEYTTDEFLFDDASSTSLTEPNSHPTGTTVLNHRVVPTYKNEQSAMFVTTDKFIQSTSPVFGTCMDVNGNAPYITGGIADNLCKPESTWGVSMFFKDITGYLISRAGSGGSRNGLYLITNTLTVIVGGTEEAFAIDTSVGHHIDYQNYFNGTAWVDDLLIDGVEIFKNRSTNRGTAFDNFAPLIGARWGVATQVDPATDAQGYIGGDTISTVRLRDFELNDRQRSGQYWRGKEYLLIPVSGSSTSLGTGASTNPWVKNMVDASNQYNFKAQYVVNGGGGTNFMQAMPETPINGFALKPPWVTANRTSPSTTRSCEGVYNKYDPDLAITQYASNFTSTTYDYTDKNPNAGGGTGPEFIGNNAYSDEFQYGMLSIDEFWKDKSIPHFWGGNQPVNNSDLVTEDLITRTECLGICGDTLQADTSLTNIVNIHVLLRTSITDYTINPAYNVDNVHVNNDGHLQISNEFMTYVSPILAETRENNFTPIVEIANPIDGEFVFDDNGEIDVSWTRDGTEINDTDSVVLGPHTVLREYTNSKGLIGSDSVDVTITDDPTSDFTIRYDMDAIVDNEFEDLSMNDLNATVEGAQTITTGKWVTSQANSDHAYILGTENDILPQTEWCMTGWFERSSNTTAVQYFYGNAGSVSADRTGLFLLNTGIGAIYCRIGGQSIGPLFTGFFVESGEQLISFQSREDDTLGWVVELYIDGVLEAQAPYTGTGTNVLPIMLCGNSGSSTDPTVSASEFNGTNDDFRFYRRSLVPSEHLKIFNDGPI